jgi:hypothetical protein
MPRPTRNQRKLTDAVARWLEDARGLVNGADLLTRKAAYVESLINELCRSDRPDLAGLTTWDLQDAEYKLRTAARELVERKARLLAPVAQERAA